MKLKFTVFLLLFCALAIGQEDNKLKFNTGQWLVSQKENGDWTKWEENTGFLLVDIDPDYKFLKIYNSEKTMMHLSLLDWEVSKDENGDPIFFNEGKDRAGTHFFLTLYFKKEGYAMHVGCSKFKLYFYMNSR